MALTAVVDTSVIVPAFLTDERATADAQELLRAASVGACRGTGRHPRNLTHKQGVKEGAGVSGRMWDRGLEAEEDTMRGREDEQGEMLLSITPDALVPRDHPIRRIRAITDAASKALSPAFAEMYSDIGRPSVAPERLLKASSLMALYSIPSERQFCERLQYDLLFKWFLSMYIATPTLDHASLR